MAANWFGMIRGGECYIALGYVYSCVVTYGGYCEVAEVGGAARGLGATIGHRLHSVSDPGFCCKVKIRHQLVQLGTRWESTNWGTRLRTTDAGTNALVAENAMAIEAENMMEASSLRLQCAFLDGSKLNCEQEKHVTYSFCPRTHIGYALSSVMISGFSWSKFNKQHTYKSTNWIAADSQN